MPEADHPESRARAVPGSSGEAGDSALLLVLRVLCLDALARDLPVGVAPLPQLVEIAAGGERVRTVHEDALSGQPVADAGGHQERRQVLQLAHPTGARHRIVLLAARARLFAGIEPLAHPL